MPNNLISTAVHNSTSATTQTNAAAGTSADSRIAQIRKQVENKPQPSARADCQQEPWISIFFDGTGNNYDADIKTRKHSNVARLYDTHPDDDSTKGIYRIYVPGRRGK